MHSLRNRPFASPTLAMIAVTVLATLAIASTAVTPGTAGAAARPAKAAAKTSKAAATASLQVCKVAGTSSLIGDSFPILEAGWTGGYYTSYSLTAESAPGGCATPHAFTPGSVVLVEEATSPGVPVPGMNTAFSVSNGTLDANMPSIDLAAVTVEAGTTTLTITNTPTPPPAQGTLELCKSEADHFVQGYFNYTITGAGGFSTTQSVLAGQCDDVSVPSGSVSITEALQFPYALASVATVPAAALVSSDLNTQNAVVSVGPGATTTAFFTNATLTAYAKICKTLDRPADNVLAGQTFTYTVSTSFDGAPVPGTPASVQVTAQSYGNTPCTFLTTKKGTLLALPLGTTVTATESGLPPTTESVGTSISPANLNAGSSSSTAQFYVGNLPPPNNVYNLGAGSVTQATFTNEAFGYVEVCKTSKTIKAGTLFPFSIGGVGPIQPVPVGLCSQGFPLPVGTTTVTESPGAHVTITGVTGTSGATLSGNTATVTVPYDNENIVTFNNEINTGTLKICKAQTSSDAGLQGSSFNLSYSYVYNGTTVNGPVESLEPGQCTLPINGIPVLNSNLTPITISITEQTTPIANIGLFSVQVVGGDSVVSSPVPPTHLLSSPGGGTPATLVVNSLEGITNVTFVNGIDITSG